MNDRHPVTLCIDFDNTIYDYSVKGYNKGIIDQAPLPGAVETVQFFKSQGFVIIIFSCRGDKEGMAKWLNLHDIPFDYINENPHQFDNCNVGKPLATYYIDDRGIRFDGDWTKVKDFVMENKDGTVLYRNPR